MYDFQPTLDAVTFYIQIAAISELLRPILVIGGIVGCVHGFYRIARYFNEHG